MDPPAETSLCANCDAPRTQRYCGECGQDSAHTELHFSALFTESARTLFGWDGAMSRTIREILGSPGELVSAYVGGKRRSYVNPARFCFIGIALWIVAGNWFEIQPGFDSEGSGSSSGSVDSEVLEKVRRFVKLNLDVLLFLSIPALAGVFRLLFRHSGRGFTDCLVFVLYVFGIRFYFGALLRGVEFATGVEGLSRVNTLLALAWEVRGARVFFGTDGWWPAIWRCSAATLIHIVTTTVVAAAVALIVVFVFLVD